MSFTLDTRIQSITEKVLADLSSKKLIPGSYSISDYGISQPEMQSGKPMTLRPSSLLRTALKKNYTKHEFWLVYTPQRQSLRLSNLNEEKIFGSEDVVASQYFRISGSNRSYGFKLLGQLTPE